MKFYLFGGDIHLLDKMYECGFDGTLFLYNAAAREYFTEIAMSASKLRRDFKYMVAIRPYVISPQYLAMIHKSIYHHVGNVLQINLISGWTKPEEIPYNAFVGDLDDASTNVEKSEYLIKYLKALDTLKNNFSNSIDEHVPDVYVSTTNKFIFDAASEYDNNMILPYRIYKKKSFYSNNIGRADGFDISGRKVIVSISPVIRNTQNELVGIEEPEHEHDLVIGTPDDIIKVLKQLKDDNIEGLLLYAWEEERDRLFEFLRQYKDQI